LPYFTHKLVEKEQVLLSIQGRGKPRIEAPNSKIETPKATEGEGIGEAFLSPANYGGLWSIVLGSFGEF